MLCERELRAVGVGRGHVLLVAVGYLAPNRRADRTVGQLIRHRPAQRVEGGDARRMAPDCGRERSVRVVIHVRRVNGKLSPERLPVREAPIILARHAARAVILLFDHRLQAREEPGWLGVRREVRTGQHCLPDTRSSVSYPRQRCTIVVGVSRRWIGVHLVDDSTEAVAHVKIPDA